MMLFIDILQGKGTNVIISGFNLFGKNVDKATGYMEDAELTKVSMM